MEDIAKYMRIENRNPDSWKNEKSHGRKEYRAFYIDSAPNRIKPFWEGDKTVWAYITLREENGKKSKEMVYGITNISYNDITANQLMKRIRDYWSV